MALYVTAIDWNPKLKEYADTIGLKHLVFPIRVECISASILGKMDYRVISQAFGKLNPVMHPSWFIYAKKANP